MVIGGLQPVTLLDYPKKVAAIIFTSGCGMRCPFCYNPNLVLPELIKNSSCIDESASLDFLRSRRKYLDGVCITGGEPTLQPDLPEFCRKVKDVGYLIKLDTNGMNPDMLEKIIAAGLADYIAMDIKGPLSQYEKFAGVNIDLEKIKKSIAIIMNCGLDYEFRSTVVKGFHTKDDIREMSKAIAGAKKYYLQNFSAQDVLVDNKFSGRSFLPAEMEEMREVAGRTVEVCFVR